MVDALSRSTVEDLIPGMCRAASPLSPRALLSEISRSDGACILKDLFRRLAEVAERGALSRCCSADACRGDRRWRDEVALDVRVPMWPPYAAGPA